jgi:ADP-heptose:LPS heptosyltransferase
MGWGDDLMWLGEASKVREKEPDAVIHDGREYSPIWKNIPWVVHPDAVTDKRKILVPRKPNGNRWYIGGWLLGRIIYKKYQPIPAPYAFGKEELEEAKKILKINNVPDKFVIINPDTKNTTLAKNKDWGIKKWVALADKLSKHITIVRLKPAGPTEDISGFVEFNKPDIPNCINITVGDIRTAFAIMNYSTGIIISEGGVHHFAAAINKPAFVIYGGAITPNNTGYRDRNQINYVYDHPLTPCGSQVDCSHCRDGLDRISPEQIYKDVIQFLQP